MVAIESSLGVDIGQAVAEPVLAFPGICSLWVRQRGSEAEFWVLTEPTDDVAAERVLTDVEDLFYDRLPEMRLEIHLINPARFKPFDLATVIPPDAVRVMARG